VGVRQVCTWDLVVLGMLYLWDVCRLFYVR
jgi:hypothetical protein